MTSAEAEDPKFEAWYAQKAEDERLVTVCKSCKTAACWRGIFYCDDYVNADVEQLPVHHLRDLGLEHSDYYAASDDYPEPAPKCGLCGSELRSGFDPCDCI